MSEPVLVTADRQLADLAAAWQQAPLLALDTEFVRETTFWPIAGLIQLNDGSGTWLIDPLTITDWTPVQALFRGGPPKVLHACSEDLEVFARLLGELPRPLFDTQVGAALAGWGFGLGYGALVQQRLGIVVEKEHTRSNWVARPLSAEQCHYAALDVTWLPPLFEQLAETLAALGRFDWWRQEGERALAQARAEVPADQWYLRLHAGSRLQGAQLQFLQAICLWREEQARVRNTPRGWLLKDGECLELARWLPRDEAELARVPGVDPRRARAAAGAILELANRARASTESSWPPPPPAPLPREQGGRLQKLRRLVDARAAELGLAPELLARKRDLEALLLGGELPPSLASGWRREIIGEALLDQLEKFE
jgi:ribonuclease D